MSRIYAIAVISFFFFACEKDTPETPNYNEFQENLTDDWVWIVCEGGFQAANGSLSLYQSKDQQLYNGIYESKNNQQLGDIFQSIAFWDDLAFLVVNNSGKIEVVNRFTLENLGTIDGFTSPRFVEVISDTKAYVSDLFDDKISIINPLTFEITGAIKTSGWTEQMVQDNNHVFCLQSAKRMVYKINKQTDVIEDSLQIDFPNPNSLVIDTDENLWVLSGGESWTSTPGGITELSKTFGVLKTLEFATASSASHLTINNNGDQLYYMQEGIKTMSISATQLPVNNLVQGSEGYYSFGLNPNNGDIYAGDALDFVQNGKVLRYNASGTLLHEFTVGVIPGRFYFK